MPRDGTVGRSDATEPNLAFHRDIAVRMTWTRFADPINDLSRENIMRQATNLRDLELPMLLPESRSTPVRPTIVRCSSCS
jgi:hypothetical protein